VSVLYFTLLMVRFWARGLASYLLGLTGTARGRSAAMSIFYMLAGRLNSPMQAYPLTPAAGASLGYMTGALLALGTNLLLFFADADRLDPSRATGGLGKNDKKNRKRKEGVPKRKSLAKEE
jgi:hypothetical protein